MFAFFRRKPKGISVEDVLQLFSKPTMTSLLEIPVTTKVSAAADDNVENSWMFHLSITMVQNGFTTTHSMHRPGAATLTYSALRIHDTIKKYVPTYKQKQMLQELYDVLPIMCQRFVLYVQENTVQYRTLEKMIQYKISKPNSKASSMEEKLLDELTDFICDFEDIHASTPAFKHLVTLNILHALNYDMKPNSRVLKSLL